MKNTIHTIAKNTGVSISTVSRVLSGKAALYRISEATAIKVRAEAERCNYEPNLLAQGLRAGRTRTVGVIIPRIDNPFFATLASTVIEFLQSRGYHTILADSQEDEKEEREAVRSMMSRNVDGIIVAPTGEDAVFLENVNETVPVILMDRYFQNSTLPYISTDNCEGGRMAAEFLIAHNYKRVLSIQGVPWSMPNIRRKKGFSDVLESAGIMHEVMGDDFSVENGYKTTVAALGGGKQFDAIFAYSSTILLGAVRALSELGFAVPEDIALIAFDNNGFFDFLNPPITRVEQPLKAIGRITVETLLSKIEKQDASGIQAQRLLKPTLIIRKSC